MRRKVLVLVVGVFTTLFAASACRGVDRPTAPSAIPTPPSGIAGTPPPTGPARTFEFEGPATYPVAPYTTQSRFVLYENGRFELQYRSIGKDYLGTFSQSGDSITFQWEGWSLAGPWGATGEIDGDRLTVHYNEIMHLTDFDDAIYTLVR
jgi:hypothetical protein